MSRKNRARNFEKKETLVSEKDGSTVINNVESTNNDILHVKILIHMFVKEIVCIIYPVYSSLNIPACINAESTKW